MKTKAERQHIVDQANAIHVLEGMGNEDAPQWYKDLEQSYIDGNITFEAKNIEAKRRLMNGDY
jgi:hypothetical protein